MEPLVAEAGGVVEEKGRRAAVEKGEGKEGGGRKVPYRRPFMPLVFDAKIWNRGMYSEMK